MLQKMPFALAALCVTFSAASALAQEAPRRTTIQLDFSSQADEETIQAPPPVMVPLYKPWETLSLRELEEDIASGAVGYTPEEYNDMREMLKLLHDQLATVTGADLVADDPPEEDTAQADAAEEAAAVQPAAPPPEPEIVGTRRNSTTIIREDGRKLRQHRPLGSHRRSDEPAQDAPVIEPPLANDPATKERNSIYERIRQNRLGQ